MSGTDTVSGDVSAYAMSGTDIPCGATPTYGHRAMAYAVLRTGMVLPGKPESRSKRYKVLDNRYDEIDGTNACPGPVPT
eukprot:3941912-Rhodomonas_salina.3